MKKFNAFLVLVLLQILVVGSVSAGDFDWMDKLELRAKADASGFVTQLAARFHIGEAEVKAVISNVEKKSDAYMALRFGELSHHPVDDVLSVYKDNRSKGWGVIAKKLGIKPGSKEFHALKQGHDLGDRMEKGNMHPSENGKDNGKGNGKENRNDKGKK